MPIGLAGIGKVGAGSAKMARAGVGVLGISRAGGGGSLIPNLVKLVFEGDSLTFGTGDPGNPPTPYPTQILPMLTSGPTYSSVNIAYSGAKASDLDAGYVSRVGAQYDSTKFNILFLWAGTNDGPWANDNLVIYTSLQDLVRKARVQGYDRIAIGTTITRTGQDGNPLALNNYIRQAAASGKLPVDAVMDFAAQVEFAGAAASANTTYYYTDATHLSNLGYTRIAVYASTAVNPFITTANPAVPLNPYGWNLAAIAQAFGLTNNNRTVSYTFPANTLSEANGKTIITSGNRYWETVIDTGGQVTVGINSDAGNVFYGYHYSNSTSNKVWIAGTTSVATLGNITTGDIICHAYNQTTKRYWIRRGVAGQWNGSGTADPAAGIGGIDASTLGANVRPYSYMIVSGPQVTLRTKAIEQTGVAPSGFSAFA